MEAEKLGLHVGLEIHQRLNTSKLFCQCSSHQKEQSEAKIVRYLRPVVGETGLIDQAAAFQFSKNSAFVYRLYPNESCIVEADEEPPHELNPEALKISIQVAKMLDAKIVDEIHVMRKTVIDGSNTGGFQRTAIIATNGTIKTSLGDVRIPTICLEEESARIEIQKGNTYYYKLNGLGIPLIEITTSAEIKTPEHAKEVAQKLGMILRSTNVMRGIGTIRQDINISIDGGERIEIKGFQELDEIPDVVSTEARRQYALLKIKDELKKRGLSKIYEVPAEVTKIFENTAFPLLQRIIKQGGVVFAAKLPMFEGLMKMHCGDRTFGKEISGYADAYGLGIIHSEELEKFPLLIHEFDVLKIKLGAEERDDFFIVAGPKESCEKVCQAVIDRAAHCLIGVPKETRVADNIGSKYARPLPGSSRMYPESDIYPIRIIPEFAESIEVPKSLFEIELKLKEHMPQDLAQQLIHSHYLDDYFSINEKIHDPVLVATTLVSSIKEVKRKGFPVESLRMEYVKDMLLLVKEGILSKNTIPDSIILLTEGKTMIDIQKKFAVMPQKEIEELVSETIKENPDAKQSSIIGIVMQKTKGRAQGKLVSDIVKKQLGL